MVQEEEDHLQVHFKGWQPLPDLNEESTHGQGRQPLPDLNEEPAHGQDEEGKFMSKHISNKVSPYLNLMEILHMIKKKSIISRKVSPNISCKMDSLVCMA
jgi:hypothetical protein